MDNYHKFQSTVMFALMKPLIMTSNKCVSLQNIKDGSYDLTLYDMHTLTNLSIL